MPHGDFSDWTAIGLLVGGVQQIFWPAYSFAAIGPLQPFLDGTCRGYSFVSRVGVYVLYLSFTCSTGGTRHL